jgi:predicted permease
VSFWRKRNDDLKHELQQHFEMSVRERVERGADAAEARAAARREFGNVGLISETTRDVWGWRWLRDLREDARFGSRTLGKSVGFTITAILTLALGIGANTAIFSLIDAALLRSLPVRGAEQLVVPIWHAHKQPQHSSMTSYGDCGQVGEEGRSNQRGCSFSAPFIEEVRRQSDVFSSVAAFARGDQIDLAGNGPAVAVERPQFVSGDYFQTLGILPEAGRLFTADDDRKAAAPVIVLSHSYWRSEFAGSLSAIGKTVLLNKVPCTIVGVAEAQFDSLSPGQVVDMWIPLSVLPGIEQPWNNRELDPANWWQVVVARLQTGVTREKAQAVLNTMFKNATSGGEKPLFKPEDGQFIQLAQAEEGLVGGRQQLSAPLYVLLLSVGIVLLIACANVAGLLLARASTRQREMAVRFALGASRGRILRQLLTESVMLSIAGGAIGILLAWWCVQSIAAFLASNSGEALPFHPEIDPRVLLFTAAISIFTGVIFGLAPALRGMRVDLTPMLKAGARGDGQPEQKRKTALSAGNTLVVAQVALSIVVLAGAGLLVRTLQNLKRIDPGFDTQNILMFRIDPTLLGYKPAQSAKLFDDLQTRLSTMPGVVSATYSWSSLLNGWLWTTDFPLPGKPKDQKADADVLPVGLAFFQTMKIPLVEGREFNPQDLHRAQASEAKMAAQRAEAAERLKSGQKKSPGSPPSDSGPPIPIIVNEIFVQKYCANMNPLGQRFKPDDEPGADAPSDSGWEIIGVVRNAKYNSLRRNVAPTMYIPNSTGRVAFSLRTSGDPEKLIAPVRALIGELDGNLPVVAVRTQTQQIDRQIFKERLIARLAAFFGALALALACIGLYGLISYEVSRRTREIGIRAALGADRRTVLGMVLRQGAQLAAVGAIVGAAIALAVLRYTKSLLFGVETSDPLTLFGVVVLLVLVMLVASYIPARRAMSVDPVVALRYE